MKQSVDRTPHRTGRKASQGTVSLLFLYFCLYLFLSAVPAGAATIGTMTVQGLHSASRAELLDMLGLSEGKQIDAEKVRIGIKRAFLKG
ncbi:MAG: hypothetical protein H6R43_599, partial [Nitrospirae bacterium]|nr:hypothetical protein [Nitrospirota bacterium]